MIIEKIKLNPSGYVFCHSKFYSASDVLSGVDGYEFSTGINLLLGDIDSGNWAVSYLLSMHRNKKSSLFSIGTITINDSYDATLAELGEYSCYMDECYPLFHSRIPVDKLVKKAIRKYHLEVTSEEIRELFHIDKDRFCRPIAATGNECFRAMAAVGYVHGKKVFCFPWLSERRFSGYRYHMTDLFDIFEKLGVIAIVPKGRL